MISQLVSTLILMKMIKKQDIYTIATKLENICLFFKKIHILYDARPNMTFHNKKDSIAVTNTIKLMSL